MQCCQTDWQLSTYCHRVNTRVNTWSFMPSDMIELDHANAWWKLTECRTVIRKMLSIFVNQVKIRIQMPKVLTWNMLVKKASFHVSFLYNVWKHLGFVWTATLVIYWWFNEVVGDQLTSQLLIKWQSTKSPAQQVTEWSPQPQLSKTGYCNNFSLQGAMLWMLYSPCSCFYSFSLAKHLVTISSSIVSPECL